jgi:hypothetical protein
MAFPVYYMLLIGQNVIISVGIGIELFPVPHKKCSIPWLLFILLTITVAFMVYASHGFFNILLQK